MRRENIKEKMKRNSYLRLGKKKEAGGPEARARVGGLGFEGGEPQEKKGGLISPKRDGRRAPGSGCTVKRGGAIFKKGLERKGGSGKGVIGRRSDTRPKKKNLI